MGLASLCGMAEEKQKLEPAKLVKIRADWQRSVNRITAPLNKKYREELEKMKLEFTRANNLEDAIAVDTEIKNLDERNGGALFEEEPATNPIIGEWLVTYENGQVYRVEFLKDGTYRETGSKPNPAPKWKDQHDRILLIFPDGGTQSYLKPINPKGTKGNTIQGNKFTAVRKNK